MQVGMDLPKQPVMFMKSPSCLTGHGSAIVIPSIAANPPEVVRLPVCSRAAAHTT